MTASGRRGKLCVLSAPSGTGKTTISSRLGASGAVVIAISYTTRPPRGEEKNGQSYFFVSRPDFEKMRTAGRLLEWAEVYGNFYGTDAEWVQTQLDDGRNVLLELDCQGALQVKEKVPAAVLLFVQPPNMEALRQRLVGRGEDTPKTVERRLQAAAAEMQQKNRFDYVIINNDLDTAINEIQAILCGHGIQQGTKTSWQEQYLKTS